MDEPRLQPPCLLGDVSDPCVRAIADALPEETRVIDAPEDLPDALRSQAFATPLLVIHRSVLSPRDLNRVATLRRQAPDSRLVLCTGPIARYHQLERIAAACDRILPEAVAPDVIGRLTAWGENSFGPAPAADAPAIAVVSQITQVRNYLAEAARLIGYTPIPVPTWADAPETPLVVLDVPTLDPTWPELLESSSSAGRVIALTPFCDRSLADRFRAAGASACLELPCEPADLAWVLHRLSHAEGRIGIHAGHRVPPAPRLSRVAAALGRGTTADLN